MQLINYNYIEVVQSGLYHVLIYQYIITNHHFFIVKDITLVLGLQCPTINVKPPVVYYVFYMNIYIEHILKTIMYLQGVETVIIV